MTWKPRQQSQCGRIFSFRFLLFILFVAALVPVAFAGWSELYSGFLETSPPQIKVVDFPRGIGITPVSVVLELKDSGAGLDEVVVRTKQRGAGKEILRQSLGGRPDARVTIDFPGDKSALEEGNAEFEVKVFDRSFWNNQTERSYPLKVDYHRPKIEVLTTQHNARHGGSQLLFYRATDQALALSGVKVGSQTFLGYPARGIDKDFDDPSVFVVLYAVDLSNDISKVPVRVFAEDEVGNAVSAQFYNKIQARPLRSYQVPLTEDFLVRQVAQLAEKNLQKLQEEATRSGNTLNLPGSDQGDARLYAQFDLVNSKLRDLNDDELVSLLKNPRFDRLWFNPLVRQAGTITSGYSDQLNYTFDGKVLGSTLQTGFEVQLPRDNPDVMAICDGIVVFTRDLGVYGNTVAIDHGLGLVSIYAHLENIAVHQGDSVKAGQRLAFAGKSGFSRSQNMLLQVRIHGVPVDPVEWWDKNWFYAHINSKIEEVKRTLGIPILRPLE